MKVKLISEQTLGFLKTMPLEVDSIIRPRIIKKTKERSKMKNVRMLQWLLVLKVDQTVEIKGLE